MNLFILLDIKFFLSGSKAKYPVFITSSVYLFGAEQKNRIL